MEIGYCLTDRDDTKKAIGTVTKRFLHGAGEFLHFVKPSAKFTYMSGLSNLHANQRLCDVCQGIGETFRLPVTSYVYVASLVEFCKLKIDKMFNVCCLKQRHDIIWCTWDHRQPFAISCNHAALTDVADDQHFYLRQRPTNLMLLRSQTSFGVQTTKGTPLLTWKNLIPPWISN